jgi:hypothetical protein
MRRALLCERRTEDWADELCARPKEATNGRLSQKSLRENKIAKRLCTRKLAGVRILALAWKPTETHWARTTSARRNWAAKKSNRKTDMLAHGDERRPMPSTIQQTINQQNSRTGQHRRGKQARNSDLGAAPDEELKGKMNHTDRELKNRKSSR